MNPDVHGDTGDDVLVQMVVTERSETAFRVLHRRHAGRMHTMAVRMLGSVDDADDAVQETWLRAVPKLGTFAWRSALGTWLIAITMNVCREVLDRRGRWTMVDVDDANLSHREDGGEPIDLERAMALLPPARRATFVLHDIEGFTHEEIAQQLGCAVGTSKSQLFHARRALRRMLGEPFAGGHIRGS